MRTVAFLLPKESPWLNAIEPKWVPGKRKVVEPEELLDAEQLADRVCKVFGCAREPHLAIPQEVTWLCTSDLGAAGAAAGRPLHDPINPPTTSLRVERTLLVYVYGRDYGGPQQARAPGQETTRPVSPSGRVRIPLLSRLHVVVTLPQPFYRPSPTAVRLSNGPA